MNKIKELWNRYRNWIIVYAIGAIMGMWIWGPLLNHLGGE